MCCWQPSWILKNSSYSHVSLCFCNSYCMCINSDKVFWKKWTKDSHTLSLCFGVVLGNAHSFTQECIPLYTLICSLCIYFLLFAILLQQTLHLPLFPSFFAPVAKFFAFSRESSAGSRPGPTLNIIVMFRKFKLKIQSVKLNKLYSIHVVIMLRIQLFKHNMLHIVNSICTVFQTNYQLFNRENQGKITLKLYPCRTIPQPYQIPRGWSFCQQ